MSSTNVKTGLVRFSYPAVFAPKGFDEGGEKYGVVLIIPKKDKDTINAINQAVTEAWAQGKAKGFFKGDKIPALKNPLKDGDEQMKDGEITDNPDPAYFGSFYINCYSQNKPGLIDAFKNKIISPDIFYAGCYGRATINLYPYGIGKKGIAVGLNNIQKLKDGERLDGRKDAEQEFNDDFAEQFANDDDFDTTQPSKKSGPANDYDDL